MKIVVIALVAMGFAVGLVACNDHPKPAAPAMKHIDSAVAAAPDTIKAISVDSAVRTGPGDKAQ
jgi:hypothetical protein